VPTLLELQRDFAAAILSGDDAAIAAYIVEDGFTAAERLRIYRNGCRSILTGALRSTYRAVDRLVGRDFFGMAADEFITQHPPESGCLDDYGGAFPAFLAAFPPAAGLAYLSDVARFEWALAEAADAPETPALDPAALAAVDPGEHAGLCFEPHSSVRFLELRHPADRIADAVLSGDDAAMAAVDLAGGPVRIVVHRGPDGVAAERLDGAAWCFVRRLCAGEPLGPLADGAREAAATLLADQIVSGRLAGFRFAAVRGETAAACP
jgi:hypothetical protein